MKDREKYFAAIIQPTRLIRRTSHLIRRWEILVTDSHGTHMPARYAFTRRRAERIAQSLMHTALEAYEKRLREQLTKEW